MKEEIQMYEGRPVFEAANSEELEGIVDQYKGEAEEPYVVKISGNSVKKNSFYMDETVETVILSDSVTEIGDKAFLGCTGLTSIQIPNSVTEIGEYAFKGCTGLTSIQIPKSVTKIGDRAFFGCTGLTSIQIPDSVTEIGDYAFYGCTGLTSIQISNSKTKVGKDAFKDCPGWKKTHRTKSGAKAEESVMHTYSGTLSVRARRCCIFNIDQKVALDLVQRPTKPETLDATYNKIYFEDQEDAIIYETFIGDRYRLIVRDENDEIIYQEEDKPSFKEVLPSSDKYKTAKNYEYWNPRTKLESGKLYLLRRSTLKGYRKDFVIQTDKPFDIKKLISYYPDNVDDEWFPSLSVSRLMYEGEDLGNEEDYYDEQNWDTYIIKAGEMTGNYKGSKKDVSKPSFRRLCPQ